MGSRIDTEARAYAQEYYDDVPGWEEEDDDDLEVQHVTTNCRTLVGIEESPWSTSKFRGSADEYTMQHAHVVFVLEASRNTSTNSRAFIHDTRQSRLRRPQM